MPLKLERKLKKEYPGNPHAVYGTLNKIKSEKSSALRKAINHKIGKKYAKQGNDAAHKRIKSEGMDFNKI